MPVHQQESPDEEVLRDGLRLPLHRLGPDQDGREVDRVQSHHRQEVQARQRPGQDEEGTGVRTLDPDQVSEVQVSQNQGRLVLPDPERSERGSESEEEVHGGQGDADHRVEEGMETEDETVQEEVKEVLPIIRS